MFFNFVSLIEPKKFDDALNDANWIRAMYDELHEFEKYNVWTLVPRPNGKTILGTRWVFQNKMDKDDIITINNETLVAHGFTQIKG